MAFELFTVPRSKLIFFYKIFITTLIAHLSPLIICQEATTNGYLHKLNSFVHFGQV